MQNLGVEGQTGSSGQERRPLYFELNEMFLCFQDVFCPLDRVNMQKH